MQWGSSYGSELSFFLVKWLPPVISVCECPALLYHTARGALIIFFFQVTSAFSLRVRAPLFYAAHVSGRLAKASHGGLPLICETRPGVFLSLSP